MLTANAIAYLRTTVTSEAWTLAYAEHELIAGRRKLSFAREIVRRGGFPTEVAIDPGDCDENGDAICLTVEEYAASLIADAKAGIKYHEDKIPAAHAAFACVKLLIDHLELTEIDPDEILREQQAIMELERPLR
jgi:hypothetical protein